MQSTEVPPSMSSTAKESFDLSDYCRLCLQLPEECDLLDLQLIYDEEEHLSYYDCFTICTQIDLCAGGTYAPHQLCKSCGLELQVAYDFKKKVEESNKFLSQFEKSGISFNVEETTGQTTPLLEEFASQSTVDLVVEAEDETETETKLFTPEPLGSEITKEEVDAASQLDASMEFEELEEQVDIIDEYQSIDELVDDDAETVQIIIDNEENEIQKINPSGDSHNEVAFASNNELGPKTSDIEPKSEKNNTTSEISQLNKDEGNDEFFEYESAIGCEQTNNTKNVPPEETQTEVEVEESVLTTFETERNTSAVIITETKQPRKRFNGEHSCDYCKKVFKNRSRMLTHRRTHEPARPKFQCEECGRLYTTKQAKNVHVSTIHNQTGLKCPICGKVYVVKKLLDIHMRYHTGDFPYTCEICGRKFAQMCHLTTHKNVKHNSERYACEHTGCGKFFTSSSSLRNHEFSHSEMPFECSYCKRGYPAKSKIKVHIRQKHGMEASLEEIEDMRKFHVMRSKLNLVKITDND
ncbi:zinc finger protein 432 isoform X1 [Eurosta solidaginis]|uniref:zinc finger protein 432 isoform X1 n=1 Tax=Eurosta solidaginis TaxID=178769 RepID=UPI00353146F4